VVVGSEGMRMTVVAGYGEKVITPPLGIELTGYGPYLDRRAESVLDDLKVRVLSLSQGSEKVVLISCDLLGLTVEFCDAVRKEIAERQDMQSRNVLLACTHTHSGPASQPLRGLGSVEADYLAGVSVSIGQAVERAVADRGDAKFCYQAETVEPIGFNRRTRIFTPIDPTLKVAVFKRVGRSIYLLSYACHPVTLGRTKEISADWPGSLAREIENGGDYGIFFQGFCGDIDPVTNKNRWGRGTRDDLALYGRLLCERALKAEKYAAVPSEATIKALEKRMRLALQVPGREDIGKQRRFWDERRKGEPSAKRFLDDWEREADEKLDEFISKPCLENIPVQAIAIGELKIIGLPGEVFCEYGLRLQEKWSSLFTVGYCGGNVGYVPTAPAYEVPYDYACYFAPKFYGLFPFADEIEDVVLSESNEILTALA